MTNRVVIKIEKIVEVFFHFYISPEAIVKLTRGVEYFSKKVNHKDSSRGLMRQKNLQECVVSLGKFRAADNTQALFFEGKVREVATGSLPAMSFQVGRDCGGIQCFCFSHSKKLFGILFAKTQGTTLIHQVPLVQIFERIRSVARTCGVQMCRQRNVGVFWSFSYFLVDKIVDQSMPQRAIDLFNEILRNEVITFELGAPNLHAVIK
jgi:hypothetical protein